MKKTKKKNKIDRKIKIVISVLCCMCLAAFVYIYVLLHKEGETQDVQENQATEQDQLNAQAGQNAAPYVVPALTQRYSNSDYGFTLSIPEDFEVREFGGDDSRSITFENADHQGIQIVISPYDQKGVKKLTKEMIQSAIPDMKISDEQILEVGRNYTGLAFKSDNDAFDKDSREVWFIYKDNLYQISTYSRLDDLLRSIFGTWEFK